MGHYQWLANVWCCPYWSDIAFFSVPGGWEPVWWGWICRQLQYGWKNDAITAAPAPATGYNTVYLRVIFVGAQYTGGGAGSSTAVAFLDNIHITGCPRGTPPTLSKSFSPATIGSDSTDPLVGTTLNYSTLTFTVGNPNTSNLTGVAFTDTLPDGLVVANPATVSGFTCSSGTMTGTVTASADSNTISLSGGTIT